MSTSVIPADRSSYSISMASIGAAFLRGDAKIPSHVWPRDRHLPPEAVDGPLVGIDEVQGFDRPLPVK